MVWAVTSEEDDQEDEMDGFALAGVRSTMQGEGFPTILWWHIFVCLLNERVAPQDLLSVRFMLAFCGSSTCVP